MIQNASPLVLFSNEYKSAPCKKKRVKLTNKREACIRSDQHCVLCLGGRRISVRIDGEGFKTRHAKEQALSRQSASDSSRGNKPSSNGSSNNSSNYSRDG